MEKMIRRCGLGCARVSLIAMLTLVSGIAPQTLLAASEKSGTSNPPFEQRFQFALGGFFPTINSTVSLGPTGGGGGETIDIEDDLGIDDNHSSPWVAFNWRFYPRHRVHVEWFELNRDGSDTAIRSFSIGDTIVSAGVGLDSTIDFNLGRITYGYSFIRDDKWDVAFDVGVHIVTAKVTATASGAIIVDGVPLANGTSTESSSATTFPLPHLGASVEYAFTPKLKGLFQVLGFAIDLGDYSGTLVEVDGFMQYQFTKNFGLGGGLKYFNLDVRGKGSTLEAEFHYSFWGPAVYGYVSF